MKSLFFVLFLFSASYSHALSCREIFDFDGIPEISVARFERLLGSLGVKIESLDSKKMTEETLAYFDFSAELVGLSRSAESSGKITGFEVHELSHVLHHVSVLKNYEGVGSQNPSVHGSIRLNPELRKLIREDTGVDRDGTGLDELVAYVNGADFLVKTRPPGWKDLVHDAYTNGLMLNLPLILKMTVESVKIAENYQNQIVIREKDVTIVDSETGSVLEVMFIPARGDSSNVIFPYVFLQTAQIKAEFLVNHGIKLPEVKTDSNMRDFVMQVFESPAFKKFDENNQKTWSYISGFEFGPGPVLLLHNKLKELVKADDPNYLIDIHDILFETGI